MFRNSATYGPHHKDSASITTAAKNGCRICYTLDKCHLDDTSLPLEYDFEWSSQWRPHWMISFYEGDDRSKAKEDARFRRQDMEIFVHVSEATGTPLGYDEFLNSVSLDLETDPCRVRRDIPTLRDIPDSTGHESVAKIAKMWLQNCKENHSCDEVCGPRETGWYPERLIKVGNAEQPPRLVLRDDVHEKGGYATLSHCWGDNPEFLTLSSTNLDDLCQEIHLEKLAASFRDAIITCQRLEIPYIWIDCLCIIQSGPGSKSDWLSHSEEMDQIYLNCEVNIAIDVSSNPHEGAFRSRDPTFLQDCYVWTRFHAPEALEAPEKESNTDNDSTGENGGDSSELQDQQPGCQPGPIYLCAIFSPVDFHCSRLDLPLSKRAWVFQERLLSPRTLHFVEDRISWECETKRTLSEYLGDSEAGKEGEGFDCRFQFEYNILKRGQKGRLSDFHADLISPYTERELRYPDKDKLVAFAAAARRCSTWFNGDYCAGIYRETMPWALLWETLPYKLKAKSTNYRAPSWSWASVDGRIAIHLDEIGETAMATVDDVSVDPVDPANQFGQVKSASLTMTGPLASLKALTNNKAEEPDCPTEPLPPARRYHNMTSVLGRSFRVQPDDGNVSILEQGGVGALEEWVTSLNEGFLLAVGEFPTPFILFQSSSTTGGLVLDRLDDGNYIRVGYWEGGEGFVDHHAGGASRFQTETVTII
ncbi:hypothetical protein FZEAL_8542 [Fusarium zealandicum]|uniref:Heterokaryon incompatibility domain-containing protein n=1 Tax=Fusarium zealandicum TaxID=1053134 RepID=A0A8H4UDU3_9HYPO|nr:hypothetical protein FZEAL_8542 [Fusarium zealandicum]